MKYESPLTRGRELKQSKLQAARYHCEVAPYAGA